VPDGLEAARLSPGDRADDADFRLPGQRFVEQTAAAGVDAVDVHVHEPSQLAGLVEQEIGQRKLAKSVTERGRLELEPLLPARLHGEHRGQQDHGHYAGAASTDRIGGRSRAASVHCVPPRRDVQTDPLCVPK